MLQVGHHVAHASIMVGDGVTRTPNTTGWAAKSHVRHTETAQPTTVVRLAAASSDATKSALRAPADERYGAAER